MQIDKQSILDIADAVSKSVVIALKENGLVGSANANPKAEKTAYQKTEQLLYNYRGFCRIVEERMQEIEDLRKYGVPQTCGAGGERVQNGNLPQGIVLPEESVETAVNKIQNIIAPVNSAICLIDKSLTSLEHDPYYNIILMLYFEGRTQEDVALEYGCSQVTVSNNKKRLVRELSLRLFPEKVVSEMLF